MGMTLYDLLYIPVATLIGIWVYCLFRLAKRLPKDPREEWLSGFWAFVALSFWLLGLVVLVISHGRPQKFSIVCTGLMALTNLMRTGGHRRLLDYLRGDEQSPI